MTISVAGLASGYRQVPVIQDINFQIEWGQIVALIGLNGAGKSTLLKTILGLLKPQAGTVTLDGLSLQENHQAFASQLAYVPETPILYEALPLREHLELTALGYGLDPAVVMERAQPLLKLFRLDKQLDWFPTHFSKGMKQKVMIVCALVSDAKFLIIDEPFLGLDPLAIQQFKDILQARAQAGCAILLTTHVLGLVENLADSYLMMQAGRLYAQGSLADLQEALEAPGASLDQLYIQMASREVTA